SMHPDLERITTATADALLVSPFQNAGNGNVSATGIPLIACADYMEPTPLGQAEWMKFYGLLFGCEARSDFLFTQVETAYDSLRCAVSAVKERPRLMIDMKQGAAWYVPGGGSYLGQMYADAGADYIFSTRDESGAIPLSFESVYAAAREADVWLVKYGQAADLTYNKLAADFGPYSNFRPWRERRM
ncbi:ABC transporter substrate-binding protein, partial [Prevotella sp. MGM2]|uniref:ABC transporter substrate-binding protein n=1 Tax=Prevotella sp. MGM2 TaxID=2033406 RepID=UPI0011AB343B